MYLSNAAWSRTRKINLEQSSLELECFFNTRLRLVNSREGQLKITEISLLWIKEIKKPNWNNPKLLLGIINTYFKFFFVKKWSQGKFSAILWSPDVCLRSDFLQCHCCPGLGFNIYPYTRRNHETHQEGGGAPVTFSDLWITITMEAVASLWDAGEKYL